jgi:hypothetical protein
MTTWHLVRTPADIRQHTTIAHRTATHTLGHHPLPDPQLIAARTPAVPTAREVRERCRLGHESTSVRSAERLRRPRPRCHARPRERGQPPRPHSNDDEHQPDKPLPRQPTHRARNTTEFESNNGRRAARETSRCPINRTAARRSPAGRPTSTSAPGMLILVDGPWRDRKGGHPGASQRTSRLESMVRAPAQVGELRSRIPGSAALAFGSARTPVRSPVLASEPTIGGEPVTNCRLSRG